MKNNTIQKGKFEKFVDLHNKLKDKRHIQGDKRYSDYDSMAGLSFIMIPIGFFFIAPFVGIISIAAVFLFWTLNQTEITKREEKKDLKASRPSIRDR